MDDLATIARARAAFARAFGPAAVALVAPPALDAALAADLEAFTAAPRRPLAATLERMPTR